MLIQPANRKMMIWLLITSLFLLAFVIILVFVTGNTSPDEEAFTIINEALQIHGGCGYMEDYGIARSFRDIRLMTVGAGTTEIMYEIISKIEIDEVKHKRQIKARV